MLRGTTVAGDLTVGDGTSSRSSWGGTGIKNHGVKTYSMEESSDQKQGERQNEKCAADYGALLGVLGGGD